ncbi:ATP-binding cassette long-chain fatty acid transporter pxa1 [Extremus antarcticus]|uniref:ATP-binding cassette long-chain fatty acid transporter pxa1 n=1 Tax=Extremus antarcticus TaxID=702011 RepID=A0AAJ0DFP4_9PEZI|nr:ATP-binding cassette long-chain fatty acid transporter pxa1 [Extremus antarcticus]
MAAQSTLRPSPSERFTNLFDSFYERLVSIIDRWQHRSKLSKEATRRLATVAFALTIITCGYGGYKWRRRRRKDRDEGRKLMRLNSSKKLKDGLRVLYVDRKGQPSRVDIHTTKQSSFEAHRRLFLNPPPGAGAQQDPSKAVPSAYIRPGLNAAFLHQVSALLTIMVPRWRSKEAALLSMHAVCLIARTYLTIVVANIEGKINGALVAGKGRAFFKNIGWFLLSGLIGSGVNHQIKFLQSKISIAFRTRLTRYIHDLYLNGNLAYYKLQNLDGGIGQGADQYITHDVTLFCDAAASLFSSLGKPLVDLFVLNFQLYRSLGRLGISALLINYVFTASLLSKATPPFGRLKAKEGQKEGEFRSMHARLIANAEEVAFYAGGPTEKKQLNAEFRGLKQFMETVYRTRIAYHTLEDYVLKYSWSAYGYLISSLPVFLPIIGDLAQPPRSHNAGANTYSRHDRAEKSSERMQQFIVNKQIMLNLADAGTRMMYSIKDLSELAGYTSRVYTLISALHRVNANAYYTPRHRYPEPYSLADVGGSMVHGFDGVRLEDVPIVAPGLWPQGGEELTENLSFHVKPGEHVLITGPNGAGKSSIARIVAGLWPTYRGITCRPRAVGEDGVMFIPQRPYLTEGTLRDQVIYPHTESDMAESGQRDRDLQIVLDEAKLGYLVARESGWDTRKAWKDVLSGGEKQRMGIARLLHHKPRYAIIDEGTSAVSADVEGGLYETCKAKGITLLTISTRASLKRYHNFLLTLGLGEDAGKWEFVRIGTKSERASAEQELKELRERLEGAEGLRRRRDEVERELGRVWVEGKSGGDADALDEVTYDEQAPEG